ncbi:hypothetical protein RQP46_001064 [Phenoliferia psychrophenolica]
MSTTTYLITGASRGLGLEFARQLLASSPSVRVIAAARNPAGAAELQALIKSEGAERIVAVTMDVSDPKSIEAGVAEVKKTTLGQSGIDVLLNNAGVLAGGWNAPTASTIAELQENLQTNLFGVISTTHAFLPLLREGAGKQIWTLSSILGSIGGPTSDAPSAAMYSVSKCAVNMYLRKLARELDAEKFTVLMVHPGYVKTDMTGGVTGPADIFKEESVAGVIKTLQSKSVAQSGTFWQYSGESLPWWPRGKSSASAADDSQASNLEAQNDEHLNELHSKLKALRGPELTRTHARAAALAARQVTTDIYRDSQGQNTLLDGTSGTFDSFKTSLSSTSTRFSRNVVSGTGQARLQLGIVMGFVGLFVLYKLFR